MKLMITNGGPHPVDKWADMTTDTILELIQVADDSDTPEAAAARAAKRSLRRVLFDIFNSHHDGVQKNERRGLGSVKTLDAAHAHHAAHIDVTPHMSVMDEVKAALSAMPSPLSDHFAKPEVIAVVAQIVGSHTANVIHIERGWHRDRHVTAAKEA